MRSDGYPIYYMDIQPTKLESLPLPADWTLSISVEKMLIDNYRSWLDVVIFLSNAYVL